MSARKYWFRKLRALLPFLGVLRQLRPYLAAVQGSLAQAVLLAAVLAVVEVAAPILIGRGVDALFAPASGAAPESAPRFGPGVLLGLLAAGALLRGALVARERSLAGWIGERVAMRLRGALWDHVQHLPLDYLRARGPARLLPYFNQDAHAVQQLVTHGLIQSAEALLLGGGILLGLALLNLRMALVVAAVAPLLGLLFWRWSARLGDVSSAARRRRNRLSSYLHERLPGMAVIKAFAQRSPESDNFDELNRDHARRGAQLSLLAGRWPGWSATAAALAGVFALALAPQEAAAGRVTPGALVAFYMLLGLLLPICLRIGAATACLQEGQISVDRLASVFDRDPQKPRSKAPDLKVTEGEIVVEDVSCQLDKKTTLLSATTLRARRGALTAIVGPRESGQSTLFELLLQFRQPSTGQIRIDGQDIAGVSVKSLRAQVGWVAEESILFDGTIRENIAYGMASEAPQEEIRRAAQLAGADRFIAKLPKGWDTRVGPGGNRLSRGQRRQIALARALAVNPSILLFDEPPSPLDPESERDFAHTLHALSRTRTVMVAASRLPPPFAADQSFKLAPIPDRHYRPKQGAANGDAGRAVEPGDIAVEDED